MTLGDWRCIVCNQKNPVENRKCSACGEPKDQTK